MDTTPTPPGAIVIEGHVQGLSLARSLGEIGIPVYVVDIGNCIARHSRFTRKFFRCPDYKDDSFADFLVELAKKENLNGWILLPSNDHAVITLSRNSKKLAPYYKMMVPDYDQIELIYNKENLLKIAESLEIPIPDTYCFETADVDGMKINFPVITRGKHGLSFYRAIKTKAIFSENKSDLKNQLEYIQTKYDIKDTLTQTIIHTDDANKTISFTAFCIDGKIKTFWMGAKIREHPIKFGTATFAESVLEPEIVELADKLLVHLKYNGVCEIEFLKDPIDNKFKLIELNARTWLWVGLAKECGINYAVYIYNHLNNLPNNFPTNYTIGLKWRNELTDFVYSFTALRKRLFTFKTYLKQSSGKKVSALMYKGDNRPMYAYISFIFYYLQRR